MEILPAGIHYLVSPTLGILSAAFAQGGGVVYFREPSARL